MKSDLPLAKLDAIIDIDNRAQRREAYARWCATHLAQCAAAYTLPTDVLSSTDLDMSTLREQIATRIRNATLHALNEVLAVDEDSDNTIICSLVVVVPEGVKNPGRVTRNFSLAKMGQHQS